MDQMNRLSVAAGLLLALAATPLTVEAAPPVVSNAYVKIVNSRVPVPDSDEVVALDGWLHLVVRVVPLEDGSRYFTVYANLPANVGAESSTGEHYVAIGAVRHADTHPGLIIPCIMPEGFTLIQADPAHATRLVFVSLWTPRPKRNVTDLLGLPVQEDRHRRGVFDEHADQEALSIAIDGVPRR
jgi:hypothetical protein